MEIVTSLTKKELEEIISSQVKKCLDEKLTPPQLESSDRIGLAEACEITGLSRASIYKNTHEKRIPHLKFGSRLVFSRRQLTTWIEEHTVLPQNPEAEMNAALAASAQKHLRNAK
jgi:excisionase family DNA binding protein